MACRIYYLNAGPLISTTYSFDSCSGNTITFFPKPGKLYIATADDNNAPVSSSEVTVTAGDLADTTFYFTGCCNDYIFKLQSNTTMFSSSGFTLGTELIFLDSPNQEYLDYPLCSFAYSSSTSMTGITYIPEVCLYEQDYLSATTSCTNCKTTLSATCFTYFRKCCNNCSGSTSASTSCFFALNNLPGTLSAGTYYSVSHIDIGTNVCAQVVNPISLFGNDVAAIAPRGLDNFAVVQEFEIPL